MIDHRDIWKKKKEEKEKKKWVGPRIGEKLTTWIKDEW